MTLGNNAKSWHVMTGACLLVAAVFAVGDLVVPKPNANAGRAKLVSELEALTLKNREDRAKLDSGDPNGALVWRGGAEDVTPALMKSVSGLASKRRLKLKAFRPQKPEKGDAIDRLGYVVMVEGPFAQVTGFVRELEGDQTKAGVNLVQIAAQSGSSDMVSATIGLVAYTVPRDKEKA